MDKLKAVLIFVILFIPVTALIILCSPALSLVLLGQSIEEQLEEMRE